ncbi:MAG: Hsp20/alpha crystallin family protein [Candidatus Altiarchaeota archaeon]
MVEDIVVTPFFRRYRGHMPATIKLHAEVREEKRDVVLESRIAGYDEGDVSVSATPNTIDVTLVLEKNSTGDIKFHNSYFTPCPIDADRIRVEHKNGLLRVVAPKK